MSTITTTGPADWRSDDDEALRLCNAATRRVIDRLRELDAEPAETFDEAWDRLVVAMANQKDAMATIDASNVDPGLSGDSGTPEGDAETPRSGLPAGARTWRG